MRALYDDDRGEGRVYARLLQPTSTAASIAMLQAWLANHNCMQLPAMHIAWSRNGTQTLGARFSKERTP